MPHSVSLINTIAAGLGLALVFGFLAAKLRLPALVGYLLAGVIIGPFTPASWPMQALPRSSPKSASCC
jgi:CPA2 family monovalent cation:H+ antiporter-2